MSRMLSLSCFLLSVSVRDIPKLFFFAMSLGRIWASLVSIARLELACFNKNLFNFSFLLSCSCLILSNMSFSDVSPSGLLLGDVCFCSCGAAALDLMLPVHGSALLMTIRTRVALFLDLIIAQEVKKRQNNQHQAGVCVYHRRWWWRNTCLTRKDAHHIHLTTHWCLVV